MARLVIDCINGISGDMVLSALLDLGVDRKLVNIQLGKIGLSLDQPDELREGEHFHRAFREISEMITNSGLSPKVKETSLRIYKTIAIAEAEVHMTTLQDVHFHEVGRDRAIANIVGIAVALEALGIEEIYTTPIHDGKGTITCSHGEIPVPVPAVAAMKSQCDYEFVTEYIDMEMVTPSGLGVLIGIGARKIPKGMDLGRIVKTGNGVGTRNTGRGGLKISITGEDAREENRYRAYTNKRLYKSSKNKVLAGVCGGISEYYNLDPTIVRLGLAVFTLIGGAGILAYIIAALVIPSEPEYKF